MRKRLLLFLTLIVAIASSAFADEAFRTHRYDAFKPLEVNENSIVFVGNSITNMNEWRECFGNDPRILSRGNSGGLTDEWNVNIESVIAGKPAKVFYKLGTNDLGTSGSQDVNGIAERIRTFIRRFQVESPETKVYIQSILPCNKGDAKVMPANAAILAMIEAEQEAGNTNVEYIDLYDAMANIPYGGTYSYDNLHLTGRSYSIWCNEIAEKVGIDCSLPNESDMSTLYNSGLGGSTGMRATLFAGLPVTSEDILIVGGEVIHGAEWHEYFDNNNVKNRGTFWGANDLSIAQHQSQLINAILGNHYSDAPQTAPAKIILYLGLSDTDNDAFQTNYAGLLTALNNRLTELNPEQQTEIYAVSLLPWNNNVVDGKNQKIEAAVEASNLSNAHYVDITQMLEGDTSMPAKYSINNYPNGQGYAVMAQLIAEKCNIPAENNNAVTEDDAVLNYTLFNNRSEVGAAILAFAGDSNNFNGFALEKLNAMTYGTPEADLNSFKEEALEALTTLDPDKWYTIKSHRGTQYLYQASNSHVSAISDIEDQATRWKFIIREDGTYNIQNHSGLYVSQNSEPYNTEFKFRKLN